MYICYPIVELRTSVCTMYRRALLSVIVCVVLNLAALYASSDPVEDQKLAELRKCLNDLTTIGGKNKICHNQTDFETMKDSFKDYYPKMHPNKPVHENKEYWKIVSGAISDNHYKHVGENLQTCMNRTELKECKTKQYQGSWNITIKHKVFSKIHDIAPKRISCNDAREINPCILKNALGSCDNITLSYFKDMMHKLQINCQKVEVDPGNESPSDGK